MMQLGMDGVFVGSGIFKSGDPAARAGAVVRATTHWQEASEVLAQLETARVPAGPIYSAADMLEDPHFQARGLFEQVEINGKPLKIPAILPRLQGTPGGTRWPGPEVGAHNHEVLVDSLGLSESEYQALKDAGVVADR